jgi:hypothetical protein
VLDPVGVSTVNPRNTAELLERVAGKRIGYHHARGPYLQVVAFADRVAELLTGKFEITEFVRLKSIVDRGASGWSDPRLPEITQRVYDEYAQEVDGVICAAAFCGGSTYWSIMAACEFQDRGIPTVSLASLAFQDLATFTAQTRGYGDLPMLILPNDFETKQPDELTVLADAHVDELVGLLSK